MAGHKFQTLDANGNTTMEATVQASAGAADAGKLPALDANGLIDRSMTYNNPAQTFTASETIATSAIVNVWDSTGAKVRNADASGGVAKKADGTAATGFASAAAGTIDLDNVVLGGLTGLVVGTQYFLSATTPGGIVKVGDAGYPATAGHILQKIGKALTATTLKVDIGDPIILA